MKEIDDATFESDVDAWLDFVDHAGQSLLVHRSAGSVVFLQLEEYERLTGQKIDLTDDSNPSTTG